MRGLFRKVNMHNCERKGWKERQGEKNGRRKWVVYVKGFKSIFTCYSLGEHVSHCFGNCEDPHVSWEAAQYSAPITERLQNLNL